VVGGKGNLSPHFFKTMERQFELKLTNEKFYWMQGVYLIRIGRLKYIGKSNRIGLRIDQHSRVINSVLENYTQFVNIGFNSITEEKAKARYLVIAKYLLENPKIRVGTVDVLQRQMCPNMLCVAEQRLISEFYNDLGMGIKNLIIAPESGKTKRCFLAKADKATLYSLYFINLFTLFLEASLLLSSGILNKILSPCVALT